jgi:hypothetical protein
MTLSTLLANQDVDPVYAQALPEAEAVALRILEAYGPVSSDDGFYNAVDAFARATFNLKAAEDELVTALDAIREALPSSAAGLVIDASDAAGRVEGQHWQAAYLLGVCVGVQLRAMGAAR